jgi:hypothetical protein
MPGSRWKSRRPGGWQSLPHALILRGTIPRPAVPVRRGVLAAARRLDPAVLVLAWAVQIIESGGPLGLDGAAVRSRIVATDRPLLRLGLAGIHFDLGPVRSAPATRPTSTCSPPRREQVLRMPVGLVSPHYLVNGLSAVS